MSTPTPSQADNQPGIEGAAPELIDPRRAPDVLYALAKAARRDPHPDPLKPIGRSSFLIWLAILATLALVGSPARNYIHLPEFRSEIATAYHGLVGNNPNPAHVIKEIRRNPHRMEILAVTGFAAGTLLFALYYFAVYLVAMNTRRLVANAAGAIHSGARRVSAWRAEMRAKRKGSASEIVERTTAAGPEPHLQ